MYSITVITVIYVIHAITGTTHSSSYTGIIGNTVIIGRYDSTAMMDNTIATDWCTADVGGLVV